MMNSTTTHIILVFLFITTSLQILTNGKRHVPCYFVFGDSVFDNGNNNKLVTLIRADYLPYGIDFEYGPTGRYTNGPNIPDFIARRIGFGSEGPPPFASARGSNAMLRGLNYASGAAGIREDTSIQVGQRISTNQQLKNHEETVREMGILLGNQTARNRLQKCLYIIIQANNDYLNNYYFPAFVFQRIRFTPHEFADRLINQYSQQLTTLYNLEARKIAVFSAVPNGCLPQARSLYPTEGDPCVDFINNGVQIFNKKLVSLVHNLNSNLDGANFTFINTYDLVIRNLTSILGIKVPFSPCCQVIEGVGQCVPNGDVCNNRDEYRFLDNYHLTRIVQNYVASRAYNAQSPRDATPFDIRTLIQG